MPTESRAAIADILAMPSAESVWTLAPTPGVFGFTSIISSTSFQISQSAFDARIAGERDRAMSELVIYGRYPAGWDGYRAQPFSGQLLSVATGILQHAAQMAIGRGIMIDRMIPGPAPDGSVDIEFRAGGRTLMLTLDDSEPTTRISRDGYGESPEEVLLLTSDLLEQELDRLSRPQAR